MRWQPSVRDKGQGTSYEGVALVFCALVLSLLPLPADAQLGRKARTLDLGEAEAILEDQRVQTLFDQYLAGWAPLDPEGASALGIHDFDHLLTSRDDATAKSLRALPERFIRKLETEIDTRRLDRMGGLRYRTLLAELGWARSAFALRDDRKALPQLYLRARSVLDLLESQPAAPIERVRAALSRLEAWPAVLQQARQNLYRPPKVWTEAALLETDAALKALASAPALVAPTYEVAPDHEARAQAAVAAARQALESYKVYLATAVLPVSDGRFAVGEAAFDRILRERHLLDLSNTRVLRLGEKAMKAAVKELKRAARDLDRARPWQEVLRTVVSTAPAPSLPAAYQREVEAARAHFERQAVIGVTAETVRVQSTPQDLRSAEPAAGYRGLPALDRSMAGFLDVTPFAAADSTRTWPAGWVHSPQAAKGVVARETYPGRHVLAAAGRRAPSLIQRVAGSPLLAEGWALYADQLARETGWYASAAEGMASLRNKLAAAARAVADVRMHCGDWSFDQAREYLEREGLLSPAEARADALRISREPTWGSSGLLGLAEIVRLRDRMEGRLGDQFTLREFHERLLGYGKVPPALIARHMLRAWVRP